MVCNILPEVTAGPKRLSRLLVTAPYLRELQTPRILGKSRGCYADGESDN